MGVKFYNPVPLDELDDFKEKHFGSSSSTEVKPDVKLQKKVESLEKEIQDLKEKYEVVDKDLDVLAGVRDE